MFRIQLYGKGRDGKINVEQIGQPFFDLKRAIARAEFLAKTTYNWGKPQGFRIIDESKAVVHEAAV